MMEKRTDYDPRDATRRAVKQAIVLNEYLLRRAWGVLFIVFSVAMFFSIFGIAILDVSVSLGVIGSIAFAMVATGSGLIVILWTFRRVRFAVEVTHLESDPAWSRLLGYRVLVPLWIALNGSEILTALFGSFLRPTVFFLIHLGIVAYAYYATRLSFSKIPGEAVVALGSLSLTSITSLALWPFDKNPGVYGLLWGATIVIWAGCGVFARTRPIPEFEEERTGLE